MLLFVDDLPVLVPRGRVRGRVTRRAEDGEEEILRDGRSGDHDFRAAGRGGAHSPKTAGNDIAFERWVAHSPTGTQGFHANVGLRREPSLPARLSLRLLLQARPLLSG